MAYNETLAQRVRDALAPHGQHIIEKKMFGGLAFMYRGNMACGITKDDVMLRVNPKDYAQSLEQPHARQMDFTGRPMKGFLFVAGDKLTDDDLAQWVEQCVTYVQSMPPK
jgi:hypothetical protein